ncbi:hypothetical protein PMAYCL1PPCAC_03502, partial [Pristionchus mayeri]
MSAHPMMSNAIHARVQRKRIEMRNEICAKKAAEPVMATMLTQEAIAAAVTQPNALPTIRKHQNVGHHHQCSSDRWFRPEGDPIDRSEAVRSSHHPLSTVPHGISTLLHYRL